MSNYSHSSFSYNVYTHLFLINCFFESHLFLYNFIHSDCFTYTDVVSIRSTIHEFEVIIVDPLVTSCYEYVNHMLDYSHMKCSAN